MKNIRKPELKVDFLFSFLFKKLSPDILNNFFRPLLVLDHDLKVLWGNRGYYDLFQTTPLETEGFLLSRLGNGEWDLSRLTERLKETSFKQSDIADWEVTRHFHKIGTRSMLLNARQINRDRSENERHILLTIEDITRRKRREEKLEALSFTDELTHLHNRRGFLALTVDRLKLARRTKTASCLFFADVDGLKKINDTYGHAEGDSALVEIAGILKETFRESDILARFSGDEFVALLSPAPEGSEALVASRLKKSLGHFNLRKIGLHKLSLSMGSCHVLPDDASTIDEMMAKADEKLFELKKTRKILFTDEK